MMSTSRMEVLHESHVGHVRRHVSEAARKLGADEGRAGEAAIVATELATNMVKHGRGGEILINELKEAVPPALEIHALDSGPGMANVSACLRDGYSTAGSAGTGLGAVKRLSGHFQILSQPGRGTAIWALLPVSSEPPVPSAFEVAGISAALKGEELCGDSWDVHADPDRLRVLLADGLGHGPFAEEAAREAVSVFRRHHEAGPAKALEYIHQALFKTRGAAASMAEIQPGRGNLITAGVGNVAMRLSTPNNSKSLGVENGTLGSGVRKMQEARLPWEKGSLLILHSDGIGSQWKLEDYPGLALRHPGLIAGVLYRDFSRKHDDATVVVIRHTPA